MTPQLKQNYAKIDTKFLNFLVKSNLEIRVFKEQKFKGKNKISTLSSNFNRISPEKFSNSNLFVDQKDISEIFNYLQKQVNTNIYDDFENKYLGNMKDYLEILFLSSFYSKELEIIENSKKNLDLIIENLSNFSISDKKKVFYPFYPKEYSLIDHSVNVASLLYLNVSNNNNINLIKDLTFAGLILDIGKYNINYNSKNEPISIHTIKGINIIGKSETISDTIKYIVKEHHSKNLFHKSSIPLKDKLTQLASISDLYDNYRFGVVTESLDRQNHIESIKKIRHFKVRNRVYNSSIFNFFEKNLDFLN